MKIIVKTLLTMALLAIALNCIAQKRRSFPAKEIYKSEHLIINQITENSFQHISFKQTNDFGNVPCNGLIVKNKEEAIVFERVFSMRDGSR